MSSLSIKKLIWRITPAFTHRIFRDIYCAGTLLPNYYYDFKRYWKYSGINKSRLHQGAQSAKLTIDYHAIEKGLSLAQPRIGFGAAVVSRLLNGLPPFIQKYGHVTPVPPALGALNEYVAFNERSGFDVSDVRDKLESIVTDEESDQQGGTLTVTREELEAKRTASFKDFFNSRYSIRQFSGGHVPEEVIREAITLAQKTPSVCNRQTWRVYAYSKKEDIEQLTSIQNGCKGFGDRASAILVVTCDLSLFVSEGERYQAWIDGGMFSMSVCLAFHSLGYGTCCLNWSKDRHADRRLRKSFPIEPSDQIIMLIAVGTLPDTFRVAFSARRDLDEVLRLH